MCYKKLWTSCHMKKKLPDENEIVKLDSLKNLSYRESKENVW